MTLLVALSYILVLGDVNFTGSRYLTEMTKAGYDPAFSFSESRQAISAADLAIANLEGPLTSANWAPESAGKKWRFRQLPVFAQGIKEAGIDVLLLANNHIADAGPEGITETLKVLDDQGVLHPPPLQQGPLILTTAATTMELWNADVFSPPGSHPWAVRGETFARLIREKHQPGMHALAIIHDHFHGPKTKEDHQALIQSLAAAGIDWVIFGGDHETGTLEKQGKVLVHGGLGDFVFGCDCSGASKGKAVAIEIFEEGAKLTDLDVVPGYAGNGYRAIIESRKNCANGETTKLHSEAIPALSPSRPGFLPALADERDAASRIDSVRSTHLSDVL